MGTSEVYRSPLDHINFGNLFIKTLWTVIVSRDPADGYLLLIYKCLEFLKNS